MGMLRNMYFASLLFYIESIFTHSNRNSVIFIEKIKPLIETYIACLSATSVRKKAIDLNIRPPKGVVKKRKHPKSAAL